MKKSSSVSSGALILAGVIACFILSGFAALLYQTAWMRQFSLVFGTSELAIAAVLSAYMGGLALGAAIAARFVHRIRRPVLFYGVLEAGIAISALLVPWLLTLASLLYVAVFGGQPNQFYGCDSTLTDKIRCPNQRANWVTCGIIICYEYGRRDWRYINRGLYSSSAFWTKRHGLVWCGYQSYRLPNRGIHRKINWN